MILDASASCHTVNFNIGGSTTTSRKWDIRVTQYACGDYDLAGTYFQYFNAPTYTIYSFFCVTKHYKIFEFQVGQVVYNIIQQQRPTFKSIFFCFTILVQINFKYRQTKISIFAFISFLVLHGQHPQQQLQPE